MAAYFYRFIPQASSLYVDFADRIASSGGWSGAICSINYERLMELALLQKGIEPILDGPAQSPGQIELCLPHGCCHLFCESVTGMAGAVRMNPWAIKTNGPVRPLTDPTEFQQRFQREAFPPVMSFFEPSKYTTSGNAWIEQRRQQWAELANSADTIAIVGVKYRPGDAHIWDPIAATSAKVMYCCGQNAGNDYKKWIAGNPKRANDQVLNKYFKEGYNELCTALRL